MMVAALGEARLGRPQWLTCPIDCALSAGDAESHAQNILMAVGRSGGVLIKNLHSVEQVEALASRLGCIIPDSSGKHVSTIQEGRQALPSQASGTAATPGGFGGSGSRQAYLPDPLQLHTDRSTMATPPDLLLTVLHKVPDSGGEIWLVDAAEVAASLDPEHFRLLREPLFRFGALPAMPLMTTCHDGRVHFRLRQDAQIEVFDEAQEAFDAFTSAANRHRHVVQLAAGEGYVINNGWFLHGRDAYQGHRELWRALIASRLLVGGVQPSSEFVVFLDLDDCLFSFHGSGADEEEPTVAKQETAAVNDVLRKIMKLDEAQVAWVLNHVQSKHVPVWAALVSLPCVNVSPDMLRAFKNNLHDHIKYNELVRPDPALAAALSAVPVPLVVLTNNYHGHAEIVLRNLGVRSLIARIIALDDLNFEGARTLTTKPDPRAFELALAAVRASRAVLVDDSAKAVLGARRAGLMAIQMVGHLNKEHSGGFSGVSEELDESLGPWAPIVDLAELPARINAALGCS